MKTSRISLGLMEQVLMLCILAIAATVCLRVFVWADNKSDEAIERNHAITHLQSAAEVLKACGGDFAQAAKMHGGEVQADTWKLRFDEAWQQTTETASFTLLVRREETQTMHLGQARLVVLDEAQTEIASLTVAWQEGEQ